MFYLLHYWDDVTLHSRSEWWLTEGWQAGNLAALSSFTGRSLETHSCHATKHIILWEKFSHDQHSQSLPSPNIFKKHAKWSKSQTRQAGALPPSCHSLAVGPTNRSSLRFWTPAVFCSSLFIINVKHSGALLFNLRQYDLNSTVTVLNVLLVYFNASHYPM